MTLDAQLRVRRDGFELDAALRVDAGTTVALMGPNGAGKTTLLQSLAGLVPLSEGRVTLGDLVLADTNRARFVAPEHRPIGVVFQEYLLFPHLSALDNVAFGLRSRGASRAAARRAAGGWLERLGLADHAHAAPAELSGGQAQRVALARALAIEPELLLLDEPLAALDTTTRHDVRHDLARELGDFAGVRIVITHDPVDAAVLADRVVVLEDGRVVQQGTPSEVTARPRTPWVASLAGTNLYAGTTTADGASLDVGGGAALVLGTAEAPATPLLAVVSPNAVTISLERPAGSSRNCWAGVVDTVEPLAGRLRVRVAGSPTIVAEITAASGAELDITPGRHVWVSVKATEVATYPA